MNPFVSKLLLNIYKHIYTLSVSLVIIYLLSILSSEAD